MGLALLAIPWLAPSFTRTSAFKMVVPLRYYSANLRHSDEIYWPRGLLGLASGGACSSRRMTLGEHILSYTLPIMTRGPSGIMSHLDHNLDDFISGNPQIERALNMPC
jgi:hypothetical protein